MTGQTLTLLLGILDNVTLRVGDPNFVGDAQACATARAELVAALAAPDPPPAPEPQA
jgi:hypothetical protein